MFSWAPPVGNSCGARAVRGSTGAFGQVTLEIATGNTWYPRNFLRSCRMIRRRLRASRHHRAHRAQRADHPSARLRQRASSRSRLGARRLTFIAASTCCPARCDRGSGAVQLRPRRGVCPFCPALRPPFCGRSQDRGSSTANIAANDPRSLKCLGRGGEKSGYKGHLACVAQAVPSFDPR